MTWEEDNISRTFHMRNNFRRNPETCICVICIISLEHFICVIISVEIRRLVFMLFVFAKNILTLCWCGVGFLVAISVWYWNFNWWHGHMFCRDLTSLHQFCSGLNWFSATDLVLNLHMSHLPNEIDSIIKYHIASIKHSFPYQTHQFSPNTHPPFHLLDISLLICRRPFYSAHFTCTSPWAPPRVKRERKLNPLNQPVTIPPSGVNTNKGGLAMKCFCD